MAASTAEARLGIFQSQFQYTEWNQPFIGESIPLIHRHLRNCAALTPDPSTRKRPEYLNSHVKTFFSGPYPIVKEKFLIILEACKSIETFYYGAF